MTAHVHRVDGGEQTAGPAVRAHPLEQAQLFGRSMRREQRVCVSDRHQQLTGAVTLKITTEGSRHPKPR